MARFSPILIWVICGMGIASILFGSFLMTHQPDSGKQEGVAEYGLEGY